MIWRLLLLLAVLSATDGALTVAEVSRGIANELNPLMAAVLPFGLLPVIGAKVAPIAALSALCSHRTQHPLRAVQGLIAVYVGVLGYHVWGLLL
jgi:hypothetical protein